MKHFSHWDEYQWEDQIRQHENFVACFLHDLVYCLDLPMGDMQSDFYGGTGMPSDPVAASRSDAMRRWISDHEDDDHDDSDNTSDMEPRRPVCFSCVDSLDQLAAAWNIFAISHCSGNKTLLALGVNCAFAKLLARTADFTEPAKSITTALQITLGKRALFDLEELVDRLKECIDAGAKKDGVEYFILRLALIRDQLVEKLAELRR